MSESWKPSIRVWPFRTAPEEFRRLPPQNLTARRNWSSSCRRSSPPGSTRAIGRTCRRRRWFLAHPPKAPGTVAVGRRSVRRLYWLHVFPDGSRVAITEGSVGDLPS